MTNDLCVSRTEIAHGSMFAVLKSTSVQKIETSRYAKSLTRVCDNESDNE